MKLMVIAGLILLLAGCSAKYEVQRCEGVGVEQVCSYAKVSTRRDFENGLEIVYNGEARTFEFRANSVTTNISPLEYAAAGMLEAVAAGAIMFPARPLPIGEK